MQDQILIRPPKSTSKERWLHTKDENVYSKGFIKEEYSVFFVNFLLQECCKGLSRILKRRKVRLVNIRYVCSGLLGFFLSKFDYLGLRYFLPEFK